MKSLLLALLLLSGAPALAAAPPIADAAHAQPVPDSFSDPALEARARSLQRIPQPVYQSFPAGIVEIQLSARLAERRFQHIRHGLTVLVQQPLLLQLCADQDKVFIVDVGDALNYDFSLDFAAHG